METGVHGVRVRRGRSQMTFESAAVRSFHASTQKRAGNGISLVGCSLDTIQRSKLESTHQFLPSYLWPSAPSIM